MFTLRKKFKATVKHLQNNQQNIKMDTLVRHHKQKKRKGKIKEQQICVVLAKLYNVCLKTLFKTSNSIRKKFARAKMVIFRSGKRPDVVSSQLLNGWPIEVVESFRCLGHIVVSNLKDDNDIERRWRVLCVISNMICRKYKSSPDVKVTLFRSLCQIFYTCWLWTDDKKNNINSIWVTYNSIFRQLMGLSRYCSTHSMFFVAWELF